MKLKYLFILFLSAICGLATAQVQTDPDRNQKSIKIPAQPSKETDTVPTKDKNIKPKTESNIEKSNTNSLKYPVKVRELKVNKKEFSMFDDSKLRDPGEIFEKRYNDKMEEQGIRPQSMSDMFLGDIRVRGEVANIRCRDHKFPDGDLVRVMVNDQIFIPQLLLTGNFKSFDIPLKEGINTVVFIALNQGDSGPNTAEFEVYDDNKNLVSSRQWNLLTGVKAKILVIKDENLPQIQTKSEYQQAKEEKEN